FSHPNREAVEYKRATGTNFEEAQYILRLRGTGPFDVLIVPYHKGRRPSDLAVTRTFDGMLSVLRGGKATALTDWAVGMTLATAAASDAWHFFVTAQRNAANLFSAFSLFPFREFRS